MANPFQLRIGPQDKKELREALLRRGKVHESLRGRFVPPIIVDRHLGAAFWWMFHVINQDRPKAVTIQLIILLLLLSFSIGKRIFG